MERVRPVSITHRDHYVNIARRRALEANELASKNKKENQCEDTDVMPINSYMSNGEKESIIYSSYCRGGFFADQFENLANFRAHYEGTGPEIWEQSAGKLDAFVAAAGTGGTVAGVSRFLKVSRFSSPQLSPPGVCLLQYELISLIVQEKNSNIKCFLIDPPGSGLFNKVTRGVMYTKEEAEGRRLKNPFDTVTEGIGINRLTENFKLAELDGAFQGTDIQAVEMSR